MKSLVVLTLCIAAASSKPRAVEDKYKLPAGFLFGAGTSAYQTEGAWNEDGKGESFLDYAYHTLNTPSNETGDVACDSYHRYKEDIRLAEELGLNVLRISLSWSRLFPDGKVSNPNGKGIQHYHDVFAEMTARKIQPVVTLFHFDYPRWVQEEVGGWLGDKMPDVFAEFADFVFKEYGDTVKYWITVNEAVFWCQILSDFLPSPVNTVPHLTADKKDVCVKNVLLGHAKAHKVYEEKYSSTQKGMVGFGAGPQFYRGATDSQDDIDAAEQANVQTGLGLSLDPFIFGDYPEGNHPRVAFTDEEKKLIKGRLDFVGINVYTGMNVSATSGGGKSAEGDNHPDGFGGVEGAWVLRALPIWIKNRYDKVKKLPIFITENGLNAAGSPTALDDWDSHAVYFSAFLREMCAGINEDGTRIIGYAAWSLIDSFEFTNGYSNFGLIHVDFAKGTLDRTLKASSTFFKTVARTGYVPLVEAGSQPFPDPDAPTSAPSASHVAASSIPAVLAALLALIYSK